MPEVISTEVERSETERRNPQILIEVTQLRSAGDFSTQALRAGVEMTETMNIKDIDRIIEMAWEDRTSFEAIEAQFGLKEKDVIALMRREMKAGSFKMWRKRTNGRKTKHVALRYDGVRRFKSKLQRAISNNKISKR